jgi:hypothetical protein
MTTLRNELILAGCDVENCKIDFHPVYGNRFIAIKSGLSHCHKSYKGIIDAILDEKFNPMDRHPFVTILTATEPENYLYKITFDSDFGMIIHKMLHSKSVEEKNENSEETMFKMEL